jgi:hypothetical protein
LADRANRFLPIPSRGWLATFGWRAYCFRNNIGVLVGGECDAAGNVSGIASDTLSSTHRYIYFRGILLRRPGLR